MRYTVVFEKGPTSYGAYVPDLPGCVAVGETLPEARTLINEAVKLHIESLLEAGERVPQPSSTAEQVEIDEPDLAVAG